MYSPIAMTESGNIFSFRSTNVLLSFAPRGPEIFALRHLIAQLVPCTMVSDGFIFSTTITETFRVFCVNYVFLTNEGLNGLVSSLLGCRCPLVTKVVHSMSKMGQE